MFEAALGFGSHATSRRKSHLPFMCELIHFLSDMVILLGCMSVNPCMSVWV